MHYIILLILSYLFTIWMIGGYVQDIAFNLTFIITMILPIILIIIGICIVGDDKNKLLNYFGGLLIVASICFYFGFIFSESLREFVFNQCNIDLPKKLEIDIPLWKWICIYVVDGFLFLLMGAGTSSEGKDKMNEEVETSETKEEIDKS